MAPKPSPNSLIHCDACGEDYSATYKRCPFCGAKNAPRPAPPPAPAPRQGGDDLDDGYVFDGQDLFDDEPEEDYSPARPKGGKRLAEKSSSNPFANAEINWPRLITFLCSLIIIIAALVIVFTVIYPQLRGSRDPSPNGSQPPSSPSEPVSPPSRPVATDPVGAATDPVIPSAPPVDPSVGSPSSIRLNKDDFTLRPGESFQLRASFTPSDWSGTVTWSSTDESLATVSADGNVVHVKPDVTRVKLVIITARAGDIQAECKVYIAGPKETPTSQPPASEPPVTVTQTPSGGGTVTVGRPGTIVNAEGGLRVRSGPGTTYEIVASLLNGNSVNVLSDAGGGWYQISFPGSGGVAVTGYIMGEYISTN